MQMQMQMQMRGGGGGEERKNILETPEKLSQCSAVCKLGDCDSWKGPGEGATGCNRVLEGDKRVEEDGRGCKRGFLRMGHARIPGKWAAIS